MAITINTLTRPGAGVPVASRSGLRAAGLALAGTGLLFVAVSFVNGVFAAISFAIARILGELRLGGGRVQEAAGRTVQTLRMPVTGYAFIGLMAMAMMLILGGVVGHLIVGAGIVGGDAALLMHGESKAIWLEAVRRLGVVTYLAAIALGLATVVEVLRFSRLSAFGSSSPRRRTDADLAMTSAATAPGNRPGAVCRCAHVRQRTGRSEARRYRRSRRTTRAMVAARSQEMNP